MAKRDRVKQRLEYWRERLDSGFPHPSDSRLAALPDELIKYFRFKGGGADPGSLKRAAEYFGLNPEDKNQSDMLLHILADVVFAKPAKGRPTGSTWDEDRLSELGQHLHNLEKRVGRLSDTEAAKKLVKVRDYKNQKWESLRQRLPAARDAFEDTLIVRLVEQKDMNPEDQRLAQELLAKHAEKARNQRPGIAEAVKKIRASFRLQTVK
jgi:hypothetical protein